MTLLDRFNPGDGEALADVRHYLEWQTDRRAAEFMPSEDDDVDLRTYLLHLQTLGVNRAALRRKMAALKRFYDWAQAEGLTASTPFAEFNLDRPFLSREQIRRRQDAAADPYQREIARLRALNHLAEHLNRSLDLQTALTATLEALVNVMGLQTAWVFLWTENAPLLRSRAKPPHDFRLAAAHNLPPGLEQQQSHYLTCPPDCHCQSLFRTGRLRRAVNVVECTRLQDSADAAGDNRGLLFHASVPIRSQEGPLGILNVATDEWQFLTASDLQLLSAVGAQVAIALDRARLYELAQAQRLRLEHELQMARLVQASLLPTQLPEIPGYALAADWRAAREMAGDFYDLFPLRDGRWGVVIADVSDKGAPAALYMAMARSLIRAKTEGTTSPAGVLAAVNAALRAQSSTDMFVTVFYAVLDPAAHTLTFANAGHNPPYLRRASGEVEQLPKPDFPLGFFEEIRWREATLTLNPNETLVMYTDGLTDAENPGGEFYGLPRLAAVVAASASLAPTLLKTLLADLEAFTQSAPQPDDITLLVLSRL